MSNTYTSVFGDQVIPPTQNSFAGYTLTANTTFYWPQSAIGDYLIADTMEISCAADYTLTMPDATEVSVGQSIVMNNVGSSVFTIVDAASGAITTVAPATVKYIYLSGNATAGGEWTTFTFGAGTSGAEASLLAGLGLKALGNTLNQDSPVVTASSSVTIPLTYRAKTLVYSPAVGGVTCSLPLAAVATDGFFVNIANQGTGSVTLNPSGSELIDGELTKALAPGESCMIVCNGVKWFSIGYGRSTQFQFTKLVYDITGTGPFTLTSLQAQNKLISFIGTATAAVTVIFPPVVAVYYLQNDYVGAFALTAKTVSGIGAATAPGVRTIVTCDGANIIQSQTSSLPITNIDGGSAGVVVYQQATNVTGFTDVGTAGQVLTSGGAGQPVWVDSATLGTAFPMMNGPAPLVGTSIWGSHEDHVHQVVPAANIPNTPSGNIVATTVQAAINELDTKKANLAGGNTFTGVQHLQADLLDGSVAVTQSALDYSTKVATTAYVHDIAMNSALPLQDPNTAGMAPISDGTTARWSPLAGNSLYLSINLGAL